MTVSKHCKALIEECPYCGSHEDYHIFKATQDIQFRCYACRFWYIIRNPDYKEPVVDNTKWDIYHFPGWNPNPTKSRFLIVAIIRGFWERGFGFTELRISKGNKHYVF